MSSDGSFKDPRTGRATDPWRVPVGIGQIPETGLHKTITAKPDELQALAAAGDLRAFFAAQAAITLTPVRDKVHVTGRVSARIEQTCVVTLDPMESTIDEPIDVMFAPPETIPSLASTIDDGEDDDDTPDLPEPIINGVIDIGRVATDALFLAIDPYPRKSDAVFELPAAADDAQAHPFAALAALKRNDD